MRGQRVGKQPDLSSEATGGSVGRDGPGEALAINAVGCGSRRATWERGSWTRPFEPTNHSRPRFGSRSRTAAIQLTAAFRTPFHPSPRSCVRRARSGAFNVLPHLPAVPTTADASLPNHTGRSTSDELIHWSGILAAL